MSEINIRDHFAAAALTGLLGGGFCAETDEAVSLAWQTADAMLRERANHIADAGKMVESSRVIHLSDCKSDGIDMSGGRREVQFLHPASDPPSTPQVPRKLPRLLSGLQELINRHSAEAGSNTPDYVLADFLDEVRHAFDAAVN